MDNAGTCVPFIVRWPEVVKPGVSNAFVCQMDLLASLAALTGQNYNDATNSQNTLAAFLGASNQGREELVVEGMFTYAFRKGEWLMIPPYPYEEHTFQLYNLRKDPAQLHNVAKEEPRLLRQLMMRFEQIKRETNKITNY